MSYCTLLTSDGYLPGAIVLGNRLKTLDQSRDRICLITKAVSVHTKKELRKYYTEVIPVDEILPYDHSSQAAQKYLGRPELGTTLAKIAVWNLSQYKQILFLDSDVLPLKDISMLFDVLDKQSGKDKPVLVASPDVGWPDVFNSGVFATCPDPKVYGHLLELAEQGVSFDGGDQGLLNEYFNEVNPFAQETEGVWVRAPFTFNVPAYGAGVGSGVGNAGSGGVPSGSGAAGYEPAYIRFKKDISAVHFLGPGNKPWMTTSTNEYHATWTQLYNELYPFTKPSELADSLRNTHTIGPDVNRWDPRTMPPPVKGVGEAVNLQQGEFKNAWDSKPQSPKIKPAAPPLPPPIFPWETRPRVITRVFDDYVIPPCHDDCDTENDTEPQYEYGEDEIVEDTGEGIDELSFSLEYADLSDEEQYPSRSGKRIVYPVTPFTSSRGRRPTGLPGIAPEFEDDEDDIDATSQVINDIHMRRTSDDGYRSHDEWDPALKLEELRRASDKLRADVPGDI